MSDDNGENMIAYIRYRLEKAQEVYQAACILYDAQQWNSVINRLYYACFYSASALLLYSKEDVQPMMEPTKHFINKIASLIEIP